MTWNREDETLEDLQLARLKLLQKKQGFRYGMDTVLLADFARIRPEDRVADFGSGSGVLPLLLMGRDKGAFFETFEILPEMAEMAGRTMEMNGVADRIRIHVLDAGDAWKELPGCGIDAVVCNPPYGRPGAVLKNPNERLATARHQEPETLKRFLTSAYRILKGRGTISLTYPAEHMLDLMDRMRECHLEPKRFRLVYPFADRPAKLVMVEGVKDARPSLQPMAPMIIYEAEGTLTNELKSVYHMDQNVV